MRIACLLLLNYIIVVKCTQKKPATFIAGFAWNQSSIIQALLSLKLLKQRQ